MTKPKPIAISYLLIVLSAISLHCAKWEMTKGELFSPQNSPTIFVGTGVAPKEVEARAFARVNLITRILSHNNVRIDSAALLMFLSGTSDSSTTTREAKELLSLVERNLKVRETTQQWVKGDSVEFRSFCVLEEDLFAPLIVAFRVNRIAEYDSISGAADAMLQKDQFVEGVSSYLKAYSLLVQTKDLFIDPKEMAEREEVCKARVYDKLHSLQFIPPAILIDGNHLKNEQRENITTRLFSIDGEKKTPVVGASINIDYSQGNLVLEGWEPKKAKQTDGNGEQKITLIKMSDPTKEDSVIVFLTFANSCNAFDLHLPSITIKLYGDGSPIDYGLMRDSSEMRTIPSGEIEIGSSASDPMAEEDEIPRTRVWIDEFAIDIHEVTNNQYKKFVQQTGYKIEPQFWNDERFNQDDQPVVGISWLDALAYAAWVGKRLPTEAEWEKAAKGPNGFRYPWGNDFNPVCVANSMNSRQSQKVRNVPSGMNAYGLYDMAGNVWEWCIDWYDGDIRKHMSGQRNPQGPNEGSQRVIRGGSWQSTEEELRCANRLALEPETRLSTVGFRCARTTKK